MMNKQKCEEIKSEFENLEKEIESFSGTNKDLNYRRLDESITKCLLKLDEIEKGDESFKQFQKELTNYGLKLIEILEKKDELYEIKQIIKTLERSFIEN